MTGFMTEDDRLMQACVKLADADQPSIIMIMTWWKTFVVRSLAVQLPPWRFDCSPHGVTTTMHTVWFHLTNQHSVLSVL